MKESLDVSIKKMCVVGARRGLLSLNMGRMSHPPTGECCSQVLPPGHPLCTSTACRKGRGSGVQSPEEMLSPPMFSYSACAQGQGKSLGVWAAGALSTWAHVRTPRLVRKFSSRENKYWLKENYQGLVSGLRLFFFFIIINPWPPSSANSTSITMIYLMSELTAFCFLKSNNFT